MIIRPRRLRINQTLRNMVRETRMSETSLIYPLFVEEGINKKEEIPSMPNQFRYSVDRLNEIMELLLQNNVDKVMLFGIPDEKDELATSAYKDDSIVNRAVRYIKTNYPQIFVICDVCLCEYTANGHCGLIANNYVDNDLTLPYLAKTALSYVSAGADMVAPSDMMDGRVLAIRNELDRNGFVNTGIMAYSVKYSSAFYGPFRDAAGSSPQFGDRKSYQMDWHNKREALKEAKLDIQEGADMVMVKPALSYLDVINEVKRITDLPIVAYSVSGEYSMIKAAAKCGYMDEDALICETATSIYRAGCDILLSYYAPEIAKFIAEGRIG